MKLFLPAEINILLDKKTTKKSKAKNIPSKIQFSTLDQNIKLSWDWQNLIVFPDLRTLMNLTTEDLRSFDWIDTLLSTNTQNQKDKSRRNIKNWNTSVILATHSEIFQNYKNLKKIIIIWPHKRYYSNQQDPRYKTQEVVEKLTEIWGCELEIIDT